MDHIFLDLSRANVKLNTNDFANQRHVVMICSEIYKAYVDFLV